MTQKTSFFAFEGGLDLSTAAIAMPPGRTVACLNYEPSANGYRRLTGYERYDGRTSPTDAFAAATTGNEQTALDAARAAITAVPGSGPVRGIWEYNGNTYAFRDNAGATACVMHRATAAGWVEVAVSRQLAFTSGGTFQVEEDDTIVGAISGAAAVIERVVVTSGSWAAGNAAGYFVTSGQTGTFQAEDVNVVGNPNVATVSGNSTQPAFPPGGRYEFVNFNFYGAANRFRMYGCNGVGQAFEFDGTNTTFITTGMAIDTPHRIEAHKNHLFLAFPGGSLQHSATGEPLSWTPILGAAELAMGDEITDLITATTSNLAIMCRNKIAILYGNDAGDWTLETLNDEAGALPWTADKVGTVMYMDNRGVRSVATSQAYGNFSVGTITQLIRPLIQQKFNTGVLPVATTRVRGKDLYRLFFSDNSGLSIYLGKKNPEILPFDLGRVVTCICSAEDADGIERIWFGSDNGFVYEMDKGRSFDGDPITYFLRLPFMHMGAPQIVKRWHRAVIECEAIPQATLLVSADFDYGDPFELGLPAVASPTTLFTVQGGGGLWDVSNWDEFYWSAQLEGLAEAYLDGVGRNMSLLIAGETALEPPHLLHGITLYFSVRGLDR